MQGWDSQPEEKISKQSKESNLLEKIVGEAEFIANLRVPSANGYID
jgi:hypothetical protein